MMQYNLDSDSASGISASERCSPDASPDPGRMQAYFDLRSTSLDRRYALPEILDAPIEGKSFLQVGCDEGEMCLEALNAGALRVAGIDADHTAIGYARRRAKEIDAPARFYTWDDLAWEPPRELFDVVVCVSEFERVLTPFDLLDKLSGITRERLILGCRPWKGRALKRRLQTRIPAWLVSPLKKLPVGLIVKRLHRGHGQLVLSPEAIRRILLYRTYRFDEVSMVDKARHVFITAKRRRIDNLIVLAGPDAAGKSTLTKKIMNGESTSILQALGIDPATNWTAVHPELVPRLDHGTQNIILHYNILNILKSYCRTFRQDPILTFLENATNLHIITLWLDAKTLETRIRKRIDAFAGNKRNEIAEKVLHFYGHSALVRSLYEDWLDFCDNMTPRSHLVCESSNNGNIYKRDDWSRLASLDSRQA